MASSGDGRPSISPRAAVVIARLPGWRRLLVQYRPDVEVYAALHAISVAALEWQATRGNVTGNVTGLAIVDSGSDAGTMTTSEVASLADTGPAAVRRAIREGRLQASRPAGRWQIPVGAAAEYARRRDGH